MSNVRIKGTLTFLGKDLSLTQDYSGDMIDCVGFNDDGTGLNIPDSSTDMEVDFNPGAFANMSLLVFRTDGAVTIKSNSTGAPDINIADFDGMAVYPGKAVLGLAGTGITKLYLTNASGAARQFSALAVRDVTP